MGPLYKEIAEYIVRMIKDGKYKPGEKIPSENEMGKLFNVSRMTARKAIEHLVSRNYLIQLQGKGTYVNNQKEKIKVYFDEMTGFNQRAMSNNKIPYTVVVKFEKKKTTKQVQNKLNITSDIVFYTERLRFINGMPVVLEVSYMPVDLFPNLKQENLSASKYKYIENLGYEIKRSVKEFFAVIPSDYVQKQLNLAANIPVFKVELLSQLENGRILEFTKIFYNQSEFRFIERVDNTKKV
ncbi:MAG: GntR family transcriptional regulator [Sporolactobacillus sp.]|nr:GntR family transcriptional regulator [Sporolactobacillus sp.]